MKISKNLSSLPYLLLSIVALLVFCGVQQSRLNTGLNQTLNDNTLKPQDLHLVVIRIDDVQDYAFRDAQQFLLNYHLDNKIPTSLAVIPSITKTDAELLACISESLKIGAELSVHGWSHEDLSKLSLSKQEQVLGEARSTLLQSFGVNVTVLVPPMFGYNNDTLTAMRVTGYDIISGSIELQTPMSSGGIVCIPGTVEYSDFLAGKWVSKSVQGLMNEIDLSINRYGYAVLVIHPQELMRNEKLDDGAIQDYVSLIKLIQTKYSFGTLKGLSKYIM